MSRDYATEMRAVIDDATRHEAYISRQVAAEVVAKLEMNDPELLKGWLHQQAPHFIWQMINDRDRSRRAHAKMTSGRSAFASASTNGDVRGFLETPFTVGGLRKKLADLTAEELTTVADDYDVRAKQNAMTAAFLRVLAKRTRTGVVGDHFSNAELAAQWASLST